MQSKIQHQSRTGRSTGTVLPYVLEREGLGSVNPCEGFRSCPALVMRLYIPLRWLSGTTAREGLRLLAGSFSAIASVFARML